MKMSKFRERAGLTQVQWAKLVGVSERQVRTIEGKNVSECSKATRMIWQAMSEKP